MLIGVLAKRTGCQVEAIRYYERISLLPEPARSASGRRVYGRKDEKRLNFVRRARSLGFSIVQIRDLLRLADSDEGVCQNTRLIAEAHLNQIRGRIEALQKIEQALA